jgi:hypothetical protein
VIAAVCLGLTVYLLHNNDHLLFIRALTWVGLLLVITIVGITLTVYFLIEAADSVRNGIRMWKFRPFVQSFFYAAAMCILGFVTAAVIRELVGIFSRR